MKKQIARALRRLARRFDDEPTVVNNNITVTNRTAPFSDEEVAALRRVLNGQGWIHNIERGIAGKRPGI